MLQEVIHSSNPFFFVVAGLVMVIGAIITSILFMMYALFLKYEDGRLLCRLLSKNIVTFFLSHVAVLLTLMYCLLESLSWMDQRYIQYKMASPHAFETSLIYQKKPEELEILIYEVHSLCKKQSCDSSNLQVIQEVQAFLKHSQTSDAEAMLLKKYQKTHHSFLLTKS